MPPHAFKAWSRPFQRATRVATMILITLALLGLLPTAAASRPAGDSSNAGHGEAAKAETEQWLGSLTEADTVAAALGTTITETPPPSFRVVDLGTLGGSLSGWAEGPYTGDAWDISNAGTVVGRAIKPGGAYRPFIYRRGDAAMSELTAVPGVFSWALGVSDNDKVVGSNNVGTGPTSTRDAFLWEAGVVTNLGNLSGDLSQNWSGGTHVNTAGRVVGFDLTDIEDAFYYDGAMHEMGPVTVGGTLLPFCDGSESDINNGGFVVSTCHTYDESSSRAFRYSTDTGEESDLGALAAGQSTRAVAVNNDDAVLGESGSNQVVWRGGAIFDLGPSFRGADISDSGAIVGNAGSGVSARGLLHTNGQLYDLTTLLPAGSGYTILEAHAINAIGEIAGRAVAPNGQQRAVVLTPGASVPIGQTYGGRWARNATHEWADPVDSATGSYSTSITDLSLPGIGVPFAMRRTYVSGNDGFGVLGKGWTASLTMSLEIDPVTGDVLLKGDDGQQVAYTKEPDGSFTPAAGGDVTLSLTGEIYELVHPDQTHYRFDSSGRLLTMKDRNGKGLALSYTADELTTVTDSVGRGITLTYLNGLLSRVTLPDGRNVQYGYTGGLLTSVVDARGWTTTYEYDAGDRLSKIVDQNLHTVVHNVYGPDGRVTDQYDARGNHSTFGWDAETQTATFTDARGKNWTDVYQSNVLQKTIDPNGHERTYEYDQDINLLAVTDPRGHKTTSTYDSRGNLLTRRAPAPLSYLQTWTYNAMNDVGTYTDGRGFTTSYGYDVAGNLTSLTGPDPDGTGPLAAPVTTITRDPAGTGLITAIRDPRGKTTQYGHDLYGNVASVVTPLGNRTTMQYDASGRMEYSVEPRGNVPGADPEQFKWRFVYDNFDQIVSQTDPLGHETTVSYDRVGLPEAKTDANGQTATYAYWETDQLKTVATPDPDGPGPQLPAVTAYGYDATHNLSSRLDPNGHTTTYGYDDAGRLVSVDTPLGKRWTYGYDASGNLTGLLDANGNGTPTVGDGLTTYGYDELNRLTSITYSDSTPAVTLTYDGNGNRRTMADGSGTVTYGYDDASRLTSVTRASDTFSYAYDPADNVVQRRYPDATVVSYSYDDDGRLQSVANTGVGTTTYGYDAAANRTTTTLPATNGYVGVRTYDQAGRLVGVKNAKGASVLAQYVRTLDNVGNPLAETVTGAMPSTRTYAYDNLNRLTSACFQTNCPNAGDPKVSWTYDGVGNRLTETRSTSSTAYTYDNDDRLTQSVATPGVNPYPGQVKADGAQPYWRLGETAGTVFSSAVGSFDGTWSGGPTLGAAGPLNNDADTAVTLNGTSQYGSVANATQLSKNNNFSLEAWVKRTKNASLQAVVGKPLSTSTKTENYAFWFDTANKVRFEVGGGGNKFATVTSAAALDTNWHHVVGTFASGALKLYVDGVQVAAVTANFTAAATNTSALNVARAGTANYYGGSLDEVALYGTALTAAQVADHRARAVNTPPSTTTTNSYDDSGRLTTSGTKTFGWNLAGRLTTATVGAQSVTYGYDGDGNRLTATSGSATTRSVWDTNNTLAELALERDGSNALLRRYIRGTEAVSMTTPGGNYFFHHDPLGSVGNVTNSGGATQWTLGYDPFGGERSTIKNGASAPSVYLRFAGQYLDGATNMYNLRARQYDPASGRFLSRDPYDATSSGTATTDPEPDTPVGDPTLPMEFQLMSPYSYARDNPVLFTDPSGESIRGALNTIVGTAREMPGTVKSSFSSPKNFGLFVGSAASYSLGVGILWRTVPLAWRSCMGTPTTLLDTLGKIKHPVTCMFLVKYVAGPGVGFLGMGGAMSRELADEQLGRSSK